MTNKAFLLGRFAACYHWITGCPKYQDLPTTIRRLNYNPKGAACDIMRRIGKTVIPPEILTEFADLVALLDMLTLTADAFPAAAVGRFYHGYYLQEQKLKTIPKKIPKKVNFREKTASPPLRDNFIIV